MDETNFESDISTNIDLSGDIQNSTDVIKPKFDTLNEPVSTTIMRDLKAIGVKFYHVFIPKKSQALLKDWDLWGPLMLCIYLSLILQNDKKYTNDYMEEITKNDTGKNNVKVTQLSGRGPQFVEVFVLTWFGSLLITINSKLLGGTL
ncbi:unnamed protein product [Gordionus sp. m RMFG-2023]